MNDYISPQEFLNRIFGDAFRRPPAPKPVFTPEEVEAAKIHGADCYASQAMVCDEERARVDRESRAWWSGYKTEGDIRGASVEWTLWSSRKRREENAAWCRTLTRPLDHEMPGDYAMRHDIPWDRNLWPAREEFFEAVRAEMAAVAAREPVV